MTNILTSYRKIILALLATTVVCPLVSAQEVSRPADAADIDWQSEIPRVVHPDKDLVELYEKTWEIAAGRVRKGPEGMIASPYLDENCYEDQIWIWDCCFMVLFSKYAPDAYPGKETLLNLYAPLHDHCPTPLRIHMRDNPPLFAWTEYENFLFSGDTAHVKHVLLEKRYLQRHFAWFDSIPKGNIDESVSPDYNPIWRDVVRIDGKNDIKGYTWTGRASGMDNTVRGRDAGGYDSILWVDAISQQALAARHIADLYRLMGHKREARQWQEKYNALKNTVNKYYWDERDGFYYDISVRDSKPCRVMTPASFWPMLAGIPSRKQAQRMVEYLRREEYLGGTRPWTSLSRSDRDHNAATGDYWRGGVWLPMVYMGTKALEQYGYYDLADTLAIRVLRQQLNTYKQVEPHTIWECYSPSDDMPSTEHGHRARAEFCGWSALGPISLFIENVLGFRHANALTRTLYWSLKKGNGTHGLRNFKFGSIVTDIIYNADNGKIEVTTNEPYTLKVNRRTIRIQAGTHTYRYGD